MLFKEINEKKKGGGTTSILFLGSFEKTAIKNLTKMLINEIEHTLELYRQSGYIEWPFGG